MFGLGFNWLRIGSSGRMVCTVMNHQVPSSWVISWPAENLSPFLEGICSIELVIPVWGVLFFSVSQMNPFLLDMLSAVILIFCAMSSWYLLQFS